MPLDRLSEDEFKRVLASLFVEGTAFGVICAVSRSWNRILKEMEKSWKQMCRANYPVLLKLQQILTDASFRDLYIRRREAYEAYHDTHIVSTSTQPPQGQSDEPLPPPSFFSTLVVSATRDASAYEVVNIRPTSHAAEPFLRDGLPTLLDNVFDDFALGVELRVFPCEEQSSVVFSHVLPINDTRQFFDGTRDEVDYHSLVDYTLPPAEQTTHTLSQDTMQRGNFLHLRVFLLRKADGKMVQLDASTYGTLGVTGYRTQTYPDMNDVCYWELWEIVKGVNMYVEVNPCFAHLPDGRATISISNITCSFELGEDNGFFNFAQANAALVCFDRNLKWV